MGEDFNATSDLAANQPEKLREMIERWWGEAGKYNVLPLDDRGTVRATEQVSTNRPLTTATYYPGAVQTPRSSMPKRRRGAVHQRPQSGREADCAHRPPELQPEWRIDGRTRPIDARNRKLPGALHLYGQAQKSSFSSES